MTPSTRAPDRILEWLPQHLAEQVADRCPDAWEQALAVRKRPASPPDPSRQTMQVEGPGGQSFAMTLNVFPIDDHLCDLHVDIEDSRSRHFTCLLPDASDASSNLAEVSRAVASFLLNEIERRRSGTSSQPPPSEWPPHVPLLRLDENGTIQDLTPGARRVLEHPNDATIEPDFFSHVHRENLRRVMRDLAHMVAHRKQRARWLLRLRTGNRRWRWYRVAADNHLDRPDSFIRVVLRRL